MNPTTKRPRSEDGFVAVTLMILALTVLLAGGLVIDGGRLMAARREAASVAASASRIAAQELDVDVFETGNAVTLVPADANTAARKFLTGQGYDNFEITITGDTVRVVIRDDVRLTILSILGTPTRPVVGTATAQLTQQGTTP